MTKEKVLALTQYVADLKSRLSSPTPKKWEHSPASYKAFLEREIRIADTKVNDAKMASK